MGGTAKHPCGAGQGRVQQGEPAVRPAGSHRPSLPARGARVAIVECPCPDRANRSRPLAWRRRPMSADRLRRSRASAPTMRPLILTPPPLVSRGRRSNGKIFRLVKRFGFVPPPLRPRPLTSGPMREPWGSGDHPAHGRAAAEPNEPEDNQASRENLANLSDLTGVSFRCDHGPPGLASQGSPHESDPPLATSRMRANQLAGWDSAVRRDEIDASVRSPERPWVSGGSGATCSFYSSRTVAWV